MFLKLGQISVSETVIIICAISLKEVTRTEREALHARKQRF